MQRQENKGRFFCSALLAETKEPPPYLSSKIVNLLAHNCFAGCTAGRHSFQQTGNCAAAGNLASGVQPRNCISIRTNNFRTCIDL